MIRDGRTTDRLVIALAAALAGGSIGLLAWDARPTFVPLDWAPGTALAWDASLSLVFFLQHSTMVRRPFRAHWRGESPPSMPIIVEGSYCWVGHPLYSCILALLWIRPEMTADGLVLSLLWSVWIILGTVLEERDLVADVGDAYEEYQRRVPMVVPRRGPAS